GEIYKGIYKNMDPIKRSAIKAWLETDILIRFQNRIIPLSHEIGLIWGKISGESESKGIKLPVIDSIIAATAIAFDLTVVSRNLQDMERCHVPVFSPWESCVVD